MKIKALFVVILLMLSLQYNPIFAQSTQMLRGAVLQHGTKIRVAEVELRNQRSGQKVRTSKLGLFELPAQIGDTLIIDWIGYQQLEVKVSSFENLILYLKPSAQLKEVTISSKKTSENFREISAVYSREKGIFYGGRPPLRLLIPINGSPLTFFHELLGKDGRRVRRLNQLAKQASQAEEIAIYFNDLIIKQTIEIDSADLEAFKLQYTPKVHQLKTWSGYQRSNYIKSAFDEFQKRKK